VRPAAKLGKPTPTLGNPTAAGKSPSAGLASWQTGIVVAASLLALVALAAGVAGRAGASRLATGIALMGAGIFSIAGGAYGWSWFIDHYKARLFVRPFGRKATRVVYGVLGGVVLLIGALASAGWIDADPKRRRFAWAAPARPQDTAAVDSGTAFHFPDRTQPPAVTGSVTSVSPPSDMRTAPPVEPVQPATASAARSVDAPPAAFSWPSEPAPSDGALVVVQNIPSGVSAAISDRLGKLTAARQMRSISMQEGETVFIFSPVADLRGLADKIDFGDVQQMDERSRRLLVRADPSKLPPAQMLEVTNPLAPDFYRQNLADLKSWDRNRRKRAVERLQKAEPKELKEEITAALLEQLAQADDKDFSIREQAVQALPNWATADQAVPALVALLADDRLADRSIKTLGTFKDVRAVEPLLKMVYHYGFQVEDALKQIGEPAEPLLLKHIDDPDEKVQKAIVKALGEVGTEKSKPALEKLARSKDFGLRSDAEDALRKLRQRR
jgi:hypothetical protein